MISQFLQAAEQAHHILSGTVDSWAASNFLPADMVAKVDSCMAQWQGVTTSICQWGLKHQKELKGEDHGELLANPRQHFRDLYKPQQPGEWSKSQTWNALDEH